MLSLQESGKVVFALDALFGLPQKKTAGRSHRPALHGSLFFCNQDSVDEFVAEESATSKRINQVLCTLVPS